MELANLICRFGDKQKLIDRFDEIVWPAFSRESLDRKFDDTRYFFHQVNRATFLSTDGEQVVAVYGRFIKDTVVRREQVFNKDKGLNVTDEINSSIYPELTQEKSLWDIANTAATIGLPRFSVISTASVGSCLALYCMTTDASYAELKAIVLDLTKLSLELSVNLLGLFLAAFSVFTAVGKTEMLVTMAKITHKESGLSYPSPPRKSGR